jgi:hypothetical protein
MQQQDKETWNTCSSSSSSSPGTRAKRLYHLLVFEKVLESTEVTDRHYHWRANAGTARPQAASVYLSAATRQETLRKTTSSSNSSKEQRLGGR